MEMASTGQTHTDPAEGADICRSSDRFFDDHRISGTADVGDWKKDGILAGDLRKSPRRFKTDIRFIPKRAPAVETIGVLPRGAHVAIRTDTGFVPKPDVSPDALSLPGDAGVFPLNPSLDGLRIPW